MKRILITGLKGYIGLSFKRWVEENKISDYKIDSISVRGNSWQELDFTKYDSIIHLSGIVHSKKSSSESYYTVNRDLTIRLAEKAKKQGVKHFVFFSTLSVYGLINGTIDNATIEAPKSDYGKSKFMAEKELQKLSNENFKLCIVRPPLVYGPDSPGNFSRLLHLFSILPFFITTFSERSMIFVDNLSNFLYKIIENEATGTWIPQNKEYVNISSVYKVTCEMKNKNPILIPFKIPNLLSKRISFFKKIFGSLKVDENLSGTKFNYQKIEFDESIIITNSKKVHNSRK
ncbi:MULTISPECIES: NAD-dependent epimerase/dehydratase family protein [unclassified Exiguobacterium]|uniref:NAD-dependent epimerase/dehydratase family protein n=1 Tax=unclassified Exiguobacterium TaxID=2644629 RepID=UPI001BE86105|nr:MULTISPECIES: NAD-dependent epimerase/dehydratase family protein [unclassified Exiguobacterium]